MGDYATHYNLHKDVVLNATVRRVERNESDTKWNLNVEINSQLETREFDKIVFCHGYQTNPNTPKFPGQENYTGKIVHSQQYRSPADFEGQKVVVVGMSNTTCDIVPYLVNYASKVYCSHRSGNIVGARYRNGRPGDLIVSYRKRTINWWIQERFPGLHTSLADWAVKTFAKDLPGYKTDPQWRLGSVRSITHKLPGTVDEIIPNLADGSATSLHGIKAFLGGKRVEFDNGTILEDVDAIILATGYQADFKPAPFVEMSKPSDKTYGGGDIARFVSPDLSS